MFGFWGGPAIRKSVMFRVGVIGMGWEERAKKDEISVCPVSIPSESL